MVNVFDTRGLDSSKRVTPRTYTLVSLPYLAHGIKEKNNGKGKKWADFFNLSLY
jgi:hypothetical protein